MEIEKLYKEIVITIRDTENEDETVNQLERAMQFFCGTYDKCEGYKHALLLTLDDQFDNHIEDLTESELKQLLDILNGAI